MKSQGWTTTKILGKIKTNHGTSQKNTKYKTFWMQWLILLDNSITILKKELHSLLIFADMKTFLERNARVGSKRKRYVFYFKSWTQQAMTDIAITFYLGSRAKFHLTKLQILMNIFGERSFQHSLEMFRFNKKGRRRFLYIRWSSK